MYIEKWSLTILGGIIIYLIYKINKNTEDIQALKHDLNDLEFQAGTVEDEDEVSEI